MLVLTRKPGESIYIGEDIEIVVTQLNRGKIRLGINAPQDVRIRRGELENRRAKERKRELVRASSVSD